jgi:hypothetical protein
MPALIEIAHEITKMFASLWQAGGSTAAALVGGKIVEAAATDAYQAVKKSLASNEPATKALRSFEKYPADADFQEEFNGYLLNALENDAQLRAQLEGLVGQYQTAPKQNTVNLTGNNHGPVLQDVNNSQVTIQTHHGSGDNVAGNKIVRG